LAAPAHARSVEVVVTMKKPPLAAALASQRSLTYSSFARPHRLLLAAPASRSYLGGLESTQQQLQVRIRSAIPSARIRWRYALVLNGFSVVVPESRLPALSRIQGVERVWQTARYAPQLNRTPQLIGAPVLWGPDFATAGQGMKIGIIDDGVDQTHPFFNPAGYAYPPGFPKGQRAYTTPKVIVARAFAPAAPRYAPARLPFDRSQSEHGTHVAGIAAGNNGTLTDEALRISGIAPRAYLGNYKALGIPTPGFGLNGNVPELAAAVEAAVRDGMDVINLSLGEPEVDPARDLLARALDAAAAAGVIPAVAASNDFSEFGFGSVGSPGTSARAITVGASGGSTLETPASFSSAGPTPYSLRLKPDVMAPGVDVLSSLPDGSFGTLSGTSMAAPHVAGAAALLRQRHPTWTPAQIKSALVLTGAPVRSSSVTEVSPLREGGGRIDLAAADAPLVFATPTNVAFGLVRAGTSATRTVALRDAGGGGGVWAVTLSSAQLRALVSAPTQVTVPGSLALRATVGPRAAERDVSGFAILTQNGVRRRIPVWVSPERALLRTERHVVLSRPGVYRGSTARGVARVSSYRYPDPGKGVPFAVQLPGPEVVYRVRIRRSVANFGVVVVSRDPGVRVEPRIVRAGDENRLAGFTALPQDQNPYRSQYGSPRPIAGVLVPSRGTYDIVFDTPRGGRPGGFRFRYWVDDRAAPIVRLTRVAVGRLDLAVGDGGAGVDPRSLEARLDGDAVAARYSGGRVVILSRRLSRGRHVLRLSAADYQETKNNENVSRILPNTRVLQRTIVVR
jgi:subtilisin family serine protease